MFSKMEEGLPRLRMLKFGSKEWPDGMNFDGEEWETLLVCMIKRM